MQSGKGHRSAWVEMNSPATGVMVRLCAIGLRVRMAKSALWLAGLPGWRVCAMLVQFKAAI